MKKLLTLLNAFLLLLILKTPILAAPLIDANVAIIKNNSIVNSDTGGNTQNNTAMVEKSSYSRAGVVGSGARIIQTGEADSNSTLVIAANTAIGCNTCQRPVKIKVDVALVNNKSKIHSITGSNSQDDLAVVTKASNSSSEVKSPILNIRMIRTGNADSTTKSWTLVNTQISR